MTGVRTLNLKIGDLVEVGGRRYEVVPDRQGGIAFQPAITPMSVVDEEMKTRPASAEDFERLTRHDLSDGEG